MTDLALISGGGPLAASDGVLLSQVTGSTGEVAAVLTTDLYKVEPINPPPVKPLPIVPTIDTVAGSGMQGFFGDSGLATSAAFNSPYGVAVDGAGNIFITDTFNHVIRKVNSAGIISTVAGNGKSGFGTPGVSGDGGQATTASINSPEGVAVDSAGNIFIADTPNHRIRKVTPAGIISTMAGNGTPGFSGDGGPATSASLNFQRGVAVDSAGTLYIADTSNQRIRRVR